MSENNDNSNESNSRSSEPSILQASRLGASGAPLMRSGVLRPSVLGTSVLGSTLNSATGANSKTKDDVVCNPFMKEQRDNESDSNTTDGAVGGVYPNDDVDKNIEGSDARRNDDDEEPDDRPDPLSLLRKNGLERANLFAAAKSSIPRVERSGFVFGQNVHERVVGDNINSESNKIAASQESGSTSGQLLFSSVIENAAKSSENESGVTAVGTNEMDTKTLTDVAREYEESRAQKRKYEEVETFTGEENEVNIVNVNCKLFAFVNSNWEERGRGSLRLNDSKNEQECSRVVFRTSGNLRLLLNTKVWAGMVAERSSQKSLRLTAMDNTGKIKIFLLMARPVDINQLYKALVERIDKRKGTHPEECRAANDYNCEDSKNGATATVEHPDDEEEDDEIVAQVALAEFENEQDDSAEPSQKKSINAENINS